MKWGDFGVFKRIFRPITIITVVGFIITLIKSPKPGIYISHFGSHFGPHITDTVNNSTFVFVSSLIGGTLTYFFLGIIGEIIFWIIKRKRTND